LKARGCRKIIQPSPVSERSSSLLGEVEGNETGSTKDRTRCLGRARIGSGTMAVWRKARKLRGVVGNSDDDEKFLSREGKCHPPARKEGGGVFKGRKKELVNQKVAKKRKDGPARIRNP